MPDPFNLFNVSSAFVVLAFFVILPVFLNELMRRFRRRILKCPKCGGAYRYIPQIPTSISFDNKESFVDFPIRLCVNCRDCRIEQKVFCGGCKREVNNIEVRVENNKSMPPISRVNLRISCDTCGLVRRDHRLILEIEESKHIEASIRKFAGELNKISIQED